MAYLYYEALLRQTCQRYLFSLFWYISTYLCDYVIVYIAIVQDIDILHFIGIMYLETCPKEERRCSLLSESVRIHTILLPYLMVYTKLTFKIELRHVTFLRGIYLLISPHPLYIQFC